MEKDEKALLDELKFFDINNLYQKGSYIDFIFQNFWTQGYILKARSNNKYDLSFLYHPNDTKNVPEISNKFLGFFGEHSYKNEIDLRNVIFNKELYMMDIKQIFQKFKLKLKKSNLDFDFENKEKKKSKNKEKEKELEKNNKQNKNEDNNIITNDMKSEQKEKNDIIKENKEEEKEEKKMEEKEVKEKQLEKKENNENDLEIENKNMIKNNEENQEKINDSNHQKEKNETEDTNEIKIEDKLENGQKHEENEQITTTSTPKKIPTTNESSISLDNNSANSQKEKDQNSSENNSPESKNKESTKILSTSLQKLDKNGNPVNISGYYTFQLLGGYLIDCCVLLKSELLTRYFKPFFKELFELCLDTIIFIAETVKNNLNKIKPLTNNRKLIIVSQIHAIIASYELVLTNFHEFYQYELSMFEEYDERLK